MTHDKPCVNMHASGNVYIWKVIPVRRGGKEHKRKEKEKGKREKGKKRKREKEKKGREKEEEKEVGVLMVGTRRTKK